MKRILITIILLPLFIFSALKLNAQKDSIPFFKGALKVEREKEYHNIINNTILNGLRQPLNEDNEMYWEDAFWAMELIQYKNKLILPQIKLAINDAKNRSVEFQRSLLEMLYTLYPKEFTKEVNDFMNTPNSKIFAMAAEYLLRAGYKKSSIIKLVQTKSNQNTNDAILHSLLENTKATTQKISKKMAQDLLSKNFLPNNVVMYSIQRKNRNFLGIVIIRDKEGNFYKDENGKIFSVPQLARSISNLPSYLTNGNTPQGIFRMYGFGISDAAFIGTTQNVQLTMPIESTLQHFLKDSTINDSIWTINYYKNLLPNSCKNYPPIFQSYYAGAAGRTEIIAHGTTVNPSYYKGQSFYPLTPTEGCLCTKEIWSSTTGKLLDSDEQKLVTALKKNGDADGYCVVIEIDDLQKAVSVNEIISLMK